MGRFSNDVWCVELDDGSRWVAKVPFRRPRPGEVLGREAAFYRRMADFPGLPIPRAFETHGAVVEVKDSALLVFEYYDLEPFSFFDGATLRHATLAIDALATWHARFWGTPLVGFPDYADLAVRRSIQARYDAAWRTERDRLVGFCPEFAGLGDALVGRLAATLEPMATPRTLIHSDAHAENVPATRNGALILDWEEPCFANPGLDLAVFTTMSFPEVDRPRYERWLVQRHAATLARFGCDWPDPWHDYRLGVLRRAARVVEIASVGFSSLAWVFRRSAIAAVQHRCEGLIR